MFLWFLSYLYFAYDFIINNNNNFTQELSDEQRRPYVEEADRLRQLHLQQYPDYKYRPRKNVRGRKAKACRVRPANGDRSGNVRGEPTTKRENSAGRRCRKAADAKRRRDTRRASTQDAAAKRRKSKSSATAPPPSTGVGASGWRSPGAASWTARADWLCEDVDDSGLDTASTTDSLPSFGLTELVAAPEVIVGGGSQVPAEYATSVYSTPEVTELIVSCTDWLSTNLTTTSPDFTTSLVNASYGQNFSS